MMKETSKQSQNKKFCNFFRFKCHYLRTGGRKHTVCSKNETSISNLYENKKKFVENGAILAP